MIKPTLRTTATKLGSVIFRDPNGSEEKHLQEIAMVLGFANFLPLEVDYIEAGGKKLIIYHGYSPHFKQIEPKTTMPVYLLKASRDDYGNVIDVTVTQRTQL